MDNEGSADIVLDETKKPHLSEKLKWGTLGFFTVENFGWVTSTNPLLRSMCLHVLFGRALGMLGGVNVVAMRQMRVVSGGFVIARLVMLGSFEVVVSGLLMVFGCLLVMIDSFH